MIVVYPASKSRHSAWWRALQAAGVPIVASWIQSCGALIEMGAALAAGRQVFIVSPYEWSVANHPRCRTFRTLHDAVHAIMAMTAGERARRDAA